jgi:50S ribosomal subunit-associated GTPase HflX
VVLNKGDVLDEATQREKLTAVEKFGGGTSWIQRRPLLISAATSQGLDPLKEAVWQQLDGNQSS